MRILNLAAAVILFTSPSLVQAQNNLALPEGLIEEHIALSVPPYWRIGEVSVIASVNEGDAIDPLFRLRFEATATSRAPLFEPVASAAEALGPFLVLIETTPAETVRTLYGTAEAAYHAGNWVTSVDIENPVSGLGRSRDTFDQPTVLVGGDDMDVARKGIETARQAAADMAVEERKRDLALEVEISALQTTHQSAVNKLITAHQDALEELREQQEKALAEMEEIADGSIESARIAVQVAGVQDEVAELKKLELAEREKNEQLAAIETARAESLVQIAKSRNAALATLRESLAQASPTDRRLILADALKSGVWALQYQALTTIISELPTLTMRYKRQGNYDKTYVDAVVVTEFDSATGNIVGFRKAGDYTPKLIGTVEQGGLSLSDEACQTSLSLNEDGQLEGFFNCSKEYFAQMLLF